MNYNAYQIGMEAYSLQCQQRSEEALELIDRSIELDPTYNKAYGLRGAILLSLGRYQEGWPLYVMGYRKPFTWNGEETNDIITIYDDLGFGDCINFSRFLPWVKERCPNVQVVVKETLRDLFKISFENITFLPFSTPISGKVCPMINLCYIFNNDPFDFKNEPYIKTNHISDIKASVGLCLNSENTNTERHEVRYIPELLRKQFLEIPNSISLEYKDLKEDSSFAETAAIINNLDLVITIDTSIAHLAGAIGKPTWILLSHDCDWRWMQNTSKTSWYPSVELIRQKTPGDWQEVVDRVIEKYINTHNTSIAPGKP